MDNASWAAAVVSAFTFLGMLVQLYKSSSQRKWDLKDREEARKKVAAELESARQILEDKMEADRYNNLVTILQQFSVVLERLAEGHQAADRAYTEANDVNLKLLQMRKDLNTTLDAVPKVVVAPVVMQPRTPRATDPEPNQV